MSGRLIVWSVVLRYVNYVNKTRFNQNRMLTRCKKRKGRQVATRSYHHVYSLHMTPNLGKMHMLFFTFEFGMMPSQSLRSGLLLLDLCSLRLRKKGCLVFWFKRDVPIVPFWGIEWYPSSMMNVRYGTSTAVHAAGRKSRKEVPYNIGLQETLIARNSKSCSNEKNIGLSFYFHSLLHCSD